MNQETITFLKEVGIVNPKIALVLGSGLGDLAEEIQSSIKIKYESIPGFPSSTVPGHEGQLVYGRLSGQKVLAMQGRFHYYEGYDLATVTYPIRVFKELGVDTILLTNAAGGINGSFKPGDLMVISDHLNFTGENPLIGQNNNQGPRFVDMSQTYSIKAQSKLMKVADQQGLHLQKGVYAWLTGPTYETPAEIRALRLLGADAVGMSTVPEAIVAKHCGMEVVGISCITNYAAGMQESLDHQEVMAISQVVKPQFKALIRAFLA